MTETPAPEGPLAGLVVIDLTRVLAGPLCTMHLGDLGAEVVKIEQPGRGDDTRAWGPPYAGGESAYYLCVNRNKRSVAIDLKAPEGLDLLKRLIVGADVVIDNFKVGTLEGWGLDSDWFAEAAPRVVRCAITGYGASGPRGGLPGYDFLLQAESGLMSITGTADGGPTKHGVALVDVCTGLNATIAILGALAARARTGRGQQVSVSLYNTSLMMLANVAANYLVSGKRPGRFGNGHPNIVPYRAYPCREGEIALAVGNDGQFASFAGVVGQADWARDARFARNADRVRNRDVIDGLVIAALQSDDARGWIDRLTAAGVPCGLIASVDEALEDPQAQATGMVRTISHPTAGDIRLVGIPYSYSDTPPSIRRAPPLLGADTDEVLAERLGLDDEALTGLRARGAIA